MSEHPLRDLARKIEALAKGHECYSQAQLPVRMCCDYLALWAHTFEMGERIREADQKIADMDASERVRARLGL